MLADMEWWEEWLSPGTGTGYQPTGRIGTPSLGTVRGERQHCNSTVWLSVHPLTGRYRGQPVYHRFVNDVYDERFEARDGPMPVIRAAQRLADTYMEGATPPEPAAQRLIACEVDHGVYEAENAADMDLVVDVPRALVPQLLDDDS